MTGIQVIECLKLAAMMVIVMALWDIDKSLYLISKHLKNRNEKDGTQ
jgi:hypothetical protein